MGEKRNVGPATADGQHERQGFDRRKNHTKTDHETDYDRTERTNIHR